MTVNIEFPASNSRPGFNIRRVNYVRVKRSRETLTDTAEIRLPRNTSELIRQQLKNWLIRGDKVIIQLGYDGELFKEFEGYIATVSSDFPVVIHCEDEMMKLKQGVINVSTRQTNLASLLKLYIPEYKIEAPTIEIGAIRMEQTTRALLLESLKDRYGILSYFQNGVLISGLEFPTPPKGRVNYQLESNVRPDSNSLVYQLAENMLVQINAGSIDQLGNSLDVTVGDPDGELIRRTFFGISNQEALKAIANRILEQTKVDGYKGGFQTYGEPFVDHGYIATISSYKYPERDGSYYVKEVDTVFTVDGMKRTVIIDKVVA